MDDFIRRGFLWLTLFLVGEVLSPGIGFCGPHVRVVEGGQPRAVIVISDDASEQIRSAASLLSKYIQMSTAAVLPVCRRSEAAARGAHSKIWVGGNQRTGSVKLDEDGFIITFPDSRNIGIAGATDWGTEFGVYAFLERYIGVRWLMPGPEGEHIPAHSTLDIPLGEIREEPAFISRQFSGLRGEAQLTWARRNRLRARVQFHHNLYNLFPPDRYSQSHPEFFPLQGGKPYRPAEANEQKWQPCFTAPGIVEEAVKNILDFFARHPQATSYSLGMNDSGNFCESETPVPREKNFAGYRDLSDPYFQWANAVAEGVLKTHPDKWFGCLAYREVAQAPRQVRVHPRIIPFMTYDRMKWIDPPAESEGKRITKEWQGQSPFLGWYDYIYGTPYLLPRVYFHQMAASYRFGHQNGVRAVYAEAYPNWGEGPKLYLASKLLWNPALDVDGLLRDWYLSAVGPLAAPDLEAYYRHWEDFWTRRIGNLKWLKEPGLYLDFNDPVYLAEVTFEDLAKSRSLLESAAAKAQTAKQRVRAGLLLRAFEYYEASAASYLGLVKGRREPGKSKEYYESLNRKRYQLMNEFEENPVLVHPSRFEGRKRLNW